MIIRSKKVYLNKQLTIKYNCQVAHDDRCKILISSLQDTLHGVETKSYGSGERSRRSRSRDRDARAHHRTPRRRERSASRYRDRSRDREDRDRSIFFSFLFILNMFIILRGMRLKSLLLLFYILGLLLRKEARGFV